MRKTPWLYSAALGVLVLDQATKHIAARALATHRPITVIPGFFDLELSYNPGGAFGVLPNWAPLFIIVALVAVFAIVRLKDVGEGSRVLSIGLGLLLGGALGNLIDRVTSRFHEVTDFISLHYGKYSWPTFNVADIGIVVGALMVLFYVYVVKRKSELASE